MRDQRDNAMMARRRLIRMEPRMEGRRRTDNLKRQPQTEHEAVHCLLGSPYLPSTVRVSGDHHTSTKANVCARRKGYWCKWVAEAKRTVSIRRHLPIPEAKCPRRSIGRASRRHLSQLGFSSLGKRRALQAFSVFAKFKSLSIPSSYRPKDPNSPKTEPRSFGQPGSVGTSPVGD